MKTQIIEIIKRSITHWERMIEWAKKQPPDKLIHWHLLEIDIGEAPTSNDCPLCQKYLKHIFKIYFCLPSCPLKKEFGKCTTKNNKYVQPFGITCEVWAIHADGFLKQLKSLLPKEED